MFCLLPSSINLVNLYCVDEMAVFLLLWDMLNYYFSITNLVLNISYVSTYRCFTALVDNWTLLARFTLA